MLRSARAFAVLVVATAAPISAATCEPRYAWRSTPYPVTAQTLARRIEPPPGFERAAVEAGGFAEWLRGLPLKPAGTPVLLHTGGPKLRQDVHVAVIDIDVGTRDLQQCADAAMRLRAEWLFAVGQPQAIAFNATGSGQPITYSRWSAGERPRISEPSLSWSRSARPDTGYASFRRYMDVVFAYAGTYSLERELASIGLADLAAGDLFIKAGFPGHAVLVVDVVESRTTGETLPAVAELHARTGDARAEEPAKRGRLALVSARIRRAAGYAGVGVPAREPQALALIGRCRDHSAPSFFSASIAAGCWGSTSSARRYSKMARSLSPFLLKTSPRLT